MTARAWKETAKAVTALVAVVGAFWWAAKSGSRKKERKPRDPSLVLVTGYCNCGACCSWKRSWFGFGDPVVSAGPDKGKPKKVGVTARGTTAHFGTLAADWKLFAPGKRLFVPGYGTGTVEDAGAAIKGRHLDCWFPTHAEARRWGRKWLKITPVE